MKKLFIVLLLIVFAAGVWLVRESSKPELFAKVERTSEILRFTNGNDTEWNNTKIMLNSTFDGPILRVPGPWHPDETKDLPLTQFVGRLNEQRFKPGFSKVQEVTIDVDGFQFGIYHFP